MIESIVTYFFLLLNLITYLIGYHFLTKEKIIINVVNVILILVITIISLMIRYYGNLFLILFSNIFFIYILLKKFYNLIFSKALYYDLICVIISLFCDAFLSLIIGNMYLQNYELLQNNYFIRNLLNIPLCFLIILITLLKPIKILSNNFYERFIKKITFSKTFIGILTLLILIILISFCLNVYNKIGKSGHLLIIFGIFYFTFLFFVILYVLYKEYQIKLLNKNIMEENKYIKDVAKQEEEFKHNLVNNLLGIKTVGNKKVNKLIDELILEYKTDYKNITNINDLPEGILSIIYRKAYDENMDNLNLAVDNLLKNELINVLSPKNYNHLCTSIGILFDNALYAVKSCKEKIIEITFLEDNEFIYYVQKNSFNNIIDLEKTGTKDFTTKKNGHGIGLNYISKLKNIEIKNTIVNNMFATKLKIKKIKM